MPIIKTNCTSIVSTDWTDPNAPTLTPGGTSQEEEITIGVPATMSFPVILFFVIIINIVALHRRTRLRFCLLSTSEVHSEEHQTQLVKTNGAYCLSQGRD